MDRRVGLRVGLLACLFVLPPKLASATVLWTATFESGDLSEWDGGTNLTKELPDMTIRDNLEVGQEMVYRGDYSCKITLHPDDTFGQYNQDRVDIKHVSTLTAEGMDSYVSGYFYLPEDAKTRNEIFFYETDQSFRNWMDLWVEPKDGGGTTVKFGIESQGADLGSVLLWTGDWTAAEWHQFAIHVHWSTNDAQGLVDVWFDGEPVIEGHQHNTKFDDNTMFFQVGIHRVLPQPYDETIYFDHFIEADTLEEIEVGAPMVEPPGMGSAGAGGVGGGGVGGTAGAIAGAGGAIGGQAGASSSGSGGTSIAAGTGGNSAAGATSVTSTTAGSGGSPNPMVQSASSSGGGCALSESRSASERWPALGALLAALVVLGFRRRKVGTD